MRVIFLFLSCTGWTRNEQETRRWKRRLGKRLESKGDRSEQHEAVDWRSQTRCQRDETGAETSGREIHVCEYILPIYCVKVSFHIIFFDSSGKNITKYLKDSGDIVSVEDIIICDRNIYYVYYYFQNDVFVDQKNKNIILYSNFR